MQSLTQPRQTSRPKSLSPVEPPTFWARLLLHTYFGFTKVHESLRVAAFRRVLVLDNSLDKRLVGWSLYLDKEVLACGFVENAAGVCALDQWLAGGKFDGTELYVCLDKSNWPARKSS